MDERSCQWSLFGAEYGSFAHPKQKLFPVDHMTNRRVFRIWSATNTLGMDVAGVAPPRLASSRLPAVPHQ